MPGGEPLAVRNATRQDVRYPPRRCPSGPSPQRGAQGPHERHPGHPQLRRCAPRSSAARVEGIFLARCRSSGGRRAARRGDGASRARRASPRPPDLSLLRASETRPAPSVPAAHPRSPPDVLSRPSRSGSQRAPQGGLPLARPHQPQNWKEEHVRIPHPDHHGVAYPAPSRTPPSRLIARLRPARRLALGLLPRALRPVADPSAPPSFPAARVHHPRRLGRRHLRR